MTRSTVNNHILHFLAFVISERLDEDVTPGLERLNAQIANMMRKKSKRRNVELLTRRIASMAN